MLAAAFSFAVMAAAAKMLPEHSAYEKVFWRSLISVLLTLLMMRGGRKNLRPHRPGMLFTRALFGFAGLTCYFEAIARIPLGTAVTVYNLTPIFAAVVGVVFLSERFSLRQALAIGVGLGGVACVKGFSADVSWQGVAFALATAFFSAIAYSLVRVLNRVEHPLTIVLAFPLVSIPLSLLLGISEFHWPSGAAWMWLLLLGLGTQGGQVCLTYALRHHNASRATQIGFVGVVFAMIFGWALGDGLPTWPQLLGAGLVFWSLVLGAAQPRRVRIFPPRR